MFYDPDRHKPLLHQIAQIHAECVLQSNTVATFLPDKKGRMDHDKMVNFWLANSEQVEKGTRAIVLQFTDESEAELAGYVSLYMKPSETRPTRGNVEKMLVSPRHRRKGVASRVMIKLEEVAREKGRVVLELDTTAGSGAEFLYFKLGYRALGVIPKYAINPKGGEVDGMLFYKDLREQA